MQESGCGEVWGFMLFVVVMPNNILMMQMHGCLLLSDRADLTWCQFSALLLHSSRGCTEGHGMIASRGRGSMTHLCVFKCLTGMAVLLLLRLLLVAVPGDGNTPVLGKQIAAFQGHHQRPWTITQREFANNVHQVCLAAYTTFVPVHKCAEAFVRPHTQLV